MFEVGDVAPDVGRGFGKELVQGEKEEGRREDYPSWQSPRAGKDGACERRNTDVQNSRCEGFVRGLEALYSSYYNYRPVSVKTTYLVVSKASNSRSTACSIPIHLETQPCT